MEIKAFHDKRDIKENTLLWKEGMKDWVPYKNLDLFTPDLDDEVPPPLPPEVFNIKPNSLKNVSLPSVLEVPEESEEVEVTTSPVSQKSNTILKIAIFFLAFAAIGSAFFVFKNSALPDLHIRGISPYNREQLENQLAVDEAMMSFAVALSMDKGNLWVTTNQKNNLSVTIDLTSNPKRLLGDDDQKEVLVRLQGMVVNHLGHFTTMKMLKGTKFYPGEYNVHIKGKKIHWINQYLKLNKHELNQSFTTDFKTLIYSGNSREFERKLIEKRVEKINKALKPWQDKLEALQTLKSMVQKNLSLFGINLSTSTKGKDFSSFERAYIKEIAPITQVIVMAAHEELPTNLEYKMGNEAIIGIGKRLGETASSMITQVTAMKKLDIKTKKKLKDAYQIKTEGLMLVVNSSISQVEIKIKELQAQTRP
jgi:hypothetical protein